MHLSGQHVLGEHKQGRPSQANERLQSTFLVWNFFLRRLAASSQPSSGDTLLCVCRHSSESVSVIRFLCQVRTRDKGHCHGPCVLNTHHCMYKFQGLQNIIGHRSSHLKAGSPFPTQTEKPRRKTSGPCSSAFLVNSVLFELFLRLML